jgi:GH35 family endo-1,4-beta-xylanase
MRYAILILLLACLLPVEALTITAEEARIKTVGGAKNGEWNIWSNGDWGDYLNLKGTGEYKLEVEAGGSPAAGVWPQMEVVVDGEVVATTEIKTPDLQVSTFSLKLADGPHCVVVRFTNDFMTATEDRNLYVRRMTLTPPVGQAEPTLCDITEWQSHWTNLQALKEKSVMGLAEADIEKYRKEDVKVLVKDATGQPVAHASIKVDQIRQEFLFGCNIFGFDRAGNPADDETYKSRFAELFNFATTGLYWSSYEPEKGHPNYAYTDKVVAWSRDHNIQLKGHPLLWGNKAGWPNWAQELPPPDLQHQRVTDIISRYKDQIHYWEVVNEASHFSEPKIDAPYRWAREVDPQAQLIVNDFEVMANGYPPFYELLRKAIANNVPFNGIGIQAHEPENMMFPLHFVRETLQHYAQLGKDLYITEFTPESSGLPVTDGLGLPTGKVWDEQTQAEYAVDFYTVCFANPTVKGITWWDLSDRNSWRKNGGLLRADLSPKPSYLALEKLIHETWTTHAQGQTDPTGNFGFRGFRGTYDVTVQVNGKTTQQEFTVSQNEPMPVQLTLSP